MFKKLSTEALAMIGSFTVFAGSVYNTERTVYNNTKNVELTHELELERMKVLQKKEQLILDSKNKVLELEIQLETLKQSKNSPTDLMEKSTLNTISSKSSLESRVGNKGSESNLNEMLLDVNKSSFLTLDNPNLMNFSTSIILNSLIGLSAIISLIINNYLEKYSDKYKEKLPK